MNRNSFKLVCLGSFLTSFSYGVMLTLPLFLSEALNLGLVRAGEIISMGIVGVILAIMAIPYWLQHVKANMIAAIGAVVYMIAILLTLTSSLFALYLAGLLLGAGWGIIYTLAPIMVSSASTTNELSKNFMFISAFNMLGAGISPMIVKIMIDQQIGIEIMFVAAALLSLSASMIFVCLKMTYSEEQRKAPVLPMIKEIVTSRSIIPLVMVFLGACIFISMMNFQFLFAADKNLNFSVFYLSYTASLLFARFYLANFILKIAQPLAIIGLLIMMLLSLCLFLVTSNNLFYIIPSSLLGISYGLVYPLIQTQIVKDAVPEKRGTILTIFSLSYFIGVFGYPYFFTLSADSGGVMSAFLILILLCLADIVFGFLLMKESASELE